MTWIKCGLNSKLVSGHFSHKDAADLGCALTVPSALVCGPGIQRATDFHGLGSSCHLQGEKPSFFNRSLQESSWIALRHCSAHACSFRVHEDFVSSQGWTDLPSSACSLASISTAWAGGLTASYGVSQAEFHAPRRTPESPLRKGFNYSER